MKRGLRTARLPNEVELAFYPYMPQKIGRVVTSYGHWSYISQWIDDEKLIQPFVEWVFVNDKPSDPPSDALRAKIARFGKLIEPPLNTGRCTARNLGVSVLETEWIDVVDGDDLPYPLAEEIDAVGEKSGLIFFEVTHHRTTAEGGRRADLDVNWTPAPLNRLIEAVIGHHDCRPVAVLWRRTDFLRLGGFDGRADYSEDLNLCVRARLAGIEFSKTKMIKASYQRETSGRMNPPIVAVGCLTTWELARLLVAGENLAAVEEQIRFSRRAILWAGMRETEKTPIGFFGKLVECAKWLLGKHR